jgi:hypothetical protein
VPGDNDHDGISDDYEDQLLLKFAPRIWLSYYENRWPVSVNWLLARSTLRYSHVRCSDHGLLPYGSVTISNLITQRHWNANDPLTSLPWNACEHYGSNNRSDGYTGDLRNSFFLQYLDYAHTGSTQPRDWVVYGHVYRGASGDIIVQYWQLYSYNDSFGPANHEGDWEFTAIRINAQEQPQRVMFSRHGHVHDVAPSAVEWVGNHHVTYSAKGSHAQYRGATVSGCVDVEVKYFSDSCNAGTAWDAWHTVFGGVVNVGERYYPRSGSEWLRYSGLWGELGTPLPGEDFTSGPRGPAYQLDSWNWGK